MFNLSGSEWQAGLDEDCTNTQLQSRVNPRRKIWNRFWWCRHIVKTLISSYSVLIISFIYSFLSCSITVLVFWGSASSIIGLLKVSHLQKILIQVPIWSGCCFNVVLRVVPPHVCSAQHFEPRLSFLAGSECRRVLVVKLLLVALPESSAGQRNSVSPRRGTGCEEVAGNVNNPPGWGCCRLSSK